MQSMTKINTELMSHRKTLDGARKKQHQIEKDSKDDVETHVNINKLSDYMNKIDEISLPLNRMISLCKSNNGGKSKRRTRKSKRTKRTKKSRRR